MAKKWGPSPITTRNQILLIHCINKEMDSPLTSLERNVALLTLRFPPCGIENTEISQAHLDF